MAGRMSTNEGRIPMPIVRLDLCYIIEHLLKIPLTPAPILQELTVFVNTFVQQLPKICNFRLEDSL